MTPFHFFVRLSIMVATGMKARDLNELADGLASVPDSVIYTHTHRFLLEHQYLVPEPANDFSLWAAEALQDRELAERLEAVDTVGYAAIKDLREALCSVVRSHLAKRPSSRSAPSGEEFHFMRSVRFSIPTGRRAGNLSEFREALRTASFSSLYLHLFEAKLRPPVGKNDFSVWFERDLGEKRLAKQVADLDPYSQTLEEIRGKILDAVDARINELSRG